jgi:hypothetical protein
MSPYADVKPAGDDAGTAARKAAATAPVGGGVCGHGAIRGGDAPRAHTAVAAGGPVPAADGVPA